MIFCPSWDLNWNKSIVIVIVTVIIHVKPISRIFLTMTNSAGKDCQSAYFGSCVDLSTIVVCSDEFLTDREFVMSKNGLKKD